MTTFLKEVTAMGLGLGVGFVDWNLHELHAEDLNTGRV